MNKRQRRISNVINARGASIIGYDDKHKPVAERRDGTRVIVRANGMPLTRAAAFRRDQLLHRASR